MASNSLKCVGAVTTGMVVIHVALPGALTAAASSACWLGSYALVAVCGKACGKCEAIAEDGALKVLSAAGKAAKTEMLGFSEDRRKSHLTRGANLAWTAGSKEVGTSVTQVTEWIDHVNVDLCKFVAWGLQFFQSNHTEDPTAILHQLLQDDPTIGKRRAYRALRNHPSLPFVSLRSIQRCIRKIRNGQSGGAV